MVIRNAILIVFLLTICSIDTSWSATATKKHKGKSKKTMETSESASISTGSTNVASEEDNELKAYTDELSNIRKLNETYHNKKKILEALDSEAEVLNENFNGFLSSKSKYETTIEKFNQTSKCTDNPKAFGCPEYEKFKLRQNLERYVDRVHYAINNNSDIPKCYFSQRQKYTNRNGGNRIKTDEELVDLYLIIGRNGKLSHAHVDFQGTSNDNTGIKELASKNIINCIVTALYNMNFSPTPNRKTITIQQPFSFL